jgi:hypothetical protein
MVAFGIAVAGAICYALMTRLQSRRGSRRSFFDGSGADGGNDVGSSWFDSHHSASLHCGGDNSTSADPGGSGGGGD